MKPLLLRLVLLAALCVAIFFAYRYSETGHQTIAETRKPPAPPKIPGLYTVEELKPYDGTMGNQILLAILGEVFDVTRGIQHYGPGNGYGGFAGKDGTRAFVTGEFNETGLIPSVDGMPPNQINDIYNWLEFYRKDYIPMGKLIGWYFDEHGQPTAKHAEYLEALKLHSLEDGKKKAFEQLYPTCNSKWSSGKGSEVWCSNKSGGVDRDWEGVPRKYIGSAYPSRCACVRVDLLSAEERDLFDLYINCNPNSIRCVTSTE